MGLDNDNFLHKQVIPINNGRDNVETTDQTACMFHISRSVIPLIPLLHS